MSANSKNIHCESALQIDQCNTTLREIANRTHPFLAGSWNHSLCFSSSLLVLATSNNRKGYSGQRAIKLEENWLSERAQLNSSRRVDLIHYHQAHHSDKQMAFILRLINSPGSPKANQRQKKSRSKWYARVESSTLLQCAHPSSVANVCGWTPSHAGVS